MRSNLTTRGWFVLGGICTFTVMIGLTAVILLVTATTQHSVNRYKSGYYHGYRNSRSYHNPNHHYYRSPSTHP